MFYVHIVCIIIMSFDLYSTYLPKSLEMFEDLTLGIVIFYQAAVFFIICKQAEVKVCPDAHGRTGEWIKLEIQTYFVYLGTIVFQILKSRFTSATLVQTPFVSQR